MLKEFATSTINRKARYNLAVLLLCRVTLQRNTLLTNEKLKTSENLKARWVNHHTYTRSFRPKVFFSTKWKMWQLTLILIYIQRLFPIITRLPINGMRKCLALFKWNNPICRFSPSRGKEWGVLDVCSLCYLLHRAEPFLSKLQSPLYDCSFLWIRFRAIIQQ